MANIDASGGNQSQNGDQGWQAIWRAIEEQRQSTQNMTRQLESIQNLMQELLRVYGIRNDDVEQGERISPVVPIVNPIPNNQRRLTMNNDDDTLEEEADWWLFAI